MRISDVLGRQGSGRRDVVTIAADASVRQVSELLASHNIGALVVRTAPDGPVEGIVSERDIVRRVHLEPDLLDAPVSSIMTRDVRTCAPEATVDELMQMMTDHRIRHVPVVEHQLETAALVGIVSIGDVVRHRIDELEFERDQLDNYLRQA